LSFTTQIIATDKRLYCRSIFWTMRLPPPSPLHPLWIVENASDCCQGNIPHITHRSAVIFCTFHYAFYLPHSTGRNSTFYQQPIGNTLWRVSTMFTLPAITPSEVNRFGWNLGQSEYIIWSWPWQILGAIHAEARAGEWAKILIFLSGKYGALLNFWKIARKWPFFQKTSTFACTENRQRLSTTGCDICETNTNRGKSWQVGTSVECWLSICTIGINSKWFPKKRHSLTSPTLPSSTTDVMSQSYMHGSANKLKLTLRYC